MRTAGVYSRFGIGCCRPEDRVDAIKGGGGQWTDGSRLKVAPENIEANIFHRGHRKVNGVNFRDWQVGITHSNTLVFDLLTIGHFG